MLKSIFSLALIGVFSSLGYLCLNNDDRVYNYERDPNYLMPSINNSVPVYKIPIIRVNGEIIGEQNASTIAYQKGVGFIESNPGIECSD